MNRRSLVAVTALAMTSWSCSAAPTVTQSARLPTPVPAPTVAGESIESFAPESTQVVAVVGIAEGAGLAIYALPGETNPLIGEIPNMADDIFGLGEAFQTPDGAIWWLVRWEALQGWVQPGLAYLSPPTDITDQLSRGADRFAAGSIDEVALAVGQSLASVDPPSRVVLVRSASGSDDIAGTAIVDVVGLGDDSVGGIRLIVSADGSPTQGARFELTAVQQIALCSRGITAVGLCL